MDVRSAVDCVASFCRCWTADSGEDHSAVWSAGGGTVAVGVPSDVAASLASAMYSGTGWKCSSWRTMMIKSPVLN